ncbi:T9SS type A sorting domain-containing protein [Chitinispirillales bacterium ANBcel5]|uniref:T9SS type A sorting domain-containing protein n=1 Tax=Cellulosispirillum alkaliphilum TaxID=3039283 RepID=UPI002A52790B|nr:T9SS type A sorting domain-containing protein [Chitinispirillales bacterium ANBcel5]
MIKLTVLLSALLSTHLFAQPFKTITFDDEPLGIYTTEQMKAAWNSPTWSNGVDEGRCHIVNDPLSEREKVLRVTYPADGVGPREGGAQWQMYFDDSYDTVYVSYMVMISEEFDPVRGGKLPGLAGGTSPTGGDIPDGTDGFSARIMWRDRSTADGNQAALTQYMYHMESTNTWGEDFFWSYPNPTWSSTRRYLRPATWHTLKTRVIMNTPGEADGRVTSWLDGDLALDSTVMLRSHEGTFGVDLFYFSTFYGGGDQSWAPSKDEYIFFDNFIFSTEDIIPQSSTSENRSNIQRKENSFRVVGPNSSVSLHLEKMPVNGNAVLKIFSLNGALIEKHSVGSNNTSVLSLSNQHYRSGLYYAVLYHENGIISAQKLPLVK